MREAGQTRKIGWRVAMCMVAVAAGMSSGCKKTEHMEGTSPKTFPSAEVGRASGLQRGESGGHERGAGDFRAGG